VHAVESASAFHAEAFSAEAEVLPAEALLLLEHAPRARRAASAPAVARAVVGLFIAVPSRSPEPPDASWTGRTATPPLGSRSDGLTDVPER
jgi:hypothetical protein